MSMLSSKVKAAAAAAAATTYMASIQHAHI